MELLSHYTSQVALFGIIRSQCLHATDFLSLNDEIEFVYALAALYDEALALTLSAIPQDLREQAEKTGLIAPDTKVAVEFVKRFLSESDGYGSVFVTSFARGRNQDEDDRGILTLWRCYTHNEGFCLQFEEETVRHFVESEANWFTYADIQLLEVTYGVDRKSDSFRDLIDQLSIRLHEQLCIATGDRRLDPSGRRRWADPHLAGEILRFCARHKDPAFSDEREIRIIACPMNGSVARPFMAPTSRKSIYRRGGAPDGARYIILGEHVLPGLVPKRILIGPKADLPMWQLEALYPRMPTFRKSDIPIR